MNIRRGRPTSTEGPPHVIVKVREMPVRFGCKVSSPIIFFHQLPPQRNLCDSTQKESLSVWVFFVTNFELWLLRIFCHASLGDMAMAQFDKKERRRGSHLISALIYAAL